MNKLLTIILLFTIMFSCSNDNITISKEEYRKLKSDTIKFEYPKTFKVNEEEYSISLGSDGHEYYNMYIGAGGYRGHERYFHYPDCKKCIKKNIL